MSTIAIDFGTARTKVATYDSVASKPVLIELGREIRSVVPSLVYIPAEGSVAVGDDAQEEIVRDPAGAVRGLKKEIHKQGFILRNGRKISPGDLLTALFERIRQDCQQFYFRGEEVCDCCLTVPVKFDQHQRDCIRQAASHAGFKNITVMEEPVAAAMHWLSQNSKDIQCVVVCDIGAGTTDIALLRRDGDELRSHPAILPHGFNQGGDDIDDLVWESLQSDNVVEPIEQADTIKLQLRKIKERFTRRAVQEDRLQLGKASLTVQRPVVEKCFTQFTQQVLGELRRLAEQMKKAGIESAPLVLAGGGASIPGLEAAIRDNKWPGEVFHWNDSEYASVLGAVTRPFSSVQPAQVTAQGAEESLRSKTESLSSASGHKSEREALKEHLENNLGAFLNDDGTLFFSPDARYNLSEIVQLTKSYVSAVHIKDLKNAWGYDIGGLVEMADMRKLEVHSRIDEGTIFGLIKLTNLRELDLAWCIWEEKPESLGFFENMPWLRVIKLPELRHFMGRTPSEQDQWVKALVSYLRPKMPGTQINY